MPRISSFYGIIIWKYFNHHNPPQFHAACGEHEMLIRISDLSVYSGPLPSRAFGLVMEWALVHQEELMQNWKLMEQELPFKKIEPLK
jgi:hypothetical protein